jgi:hypothetical protein
VEEFTDEPEVDLQIRRFGSGSEHREAALGRTLATRFPQSGLPGTRCAIHQHQFTGAGAFHSLAGALQLPQFIVSPQKRWSQVLLFVGSA